MMNRMLRTLAMAISSVRPHARLAGDFAPSGQLRADQRTEGIGPALSDGIHSNSGKAFPGKRQCRDLCDLVCHFRHDALMRCSRRDEALPLADLETREPELEHGR